MQNKSCKIALICSLIITSPYHANAAEVGNWSLGFNLGQSASDNTGKLCGDYMSGLERINGRPNEYNCDQVDDSGVSLGGNIGYQFNNVWGAEIGYVDLGETSSLVSINGSGRFTDGRSITGVNKFKFSAFYLAGTATRTLSKKLSLTGRLGFGLTDIDYTLNNRSFSDAASTIVVGGALNYKFNERWSAEFRYDHFEVKTTLSQYNNAISSSFSRAVGHDIELDEGVDNLSFGVRYTFSPTKLLKGK